MGEDEVLFARRIVAQKCLYGVDRNPMAVDLAKWACTHGGEIYSAESRFKWLRAGCGNYVAVPVMLRAGRIVLLDMRMRHMDAT